MADQKAEAIELENAKEELEEHIKETVEEQERDGEPERINVRFGNDPEVGGNDDGDPSLIKEIRTLVKGFEGQAPVRKAGLNVRRVTALDSDADGEAAIDVEYAYSV